MNKESLRASLLAKLDLERILQIDAALLSRDEATNEESRAENKYDTRGQEAAYLAEGQARLAAELSAAAVMLRNLPLGKFSPEAPVAVGALVSARTGTDPQLSWYFLSPVAGGTEIEFDGKNILVLTAASPLGRKLIGRRIGDRVSLDLAAPGKYLEIAGVE